MTQLTLSIFDPNTLLPHRAGIAGLALALSGLNPDSAPLTWDVTEDSVNLSWDCTDKEAVSWLLQQTYQIKDGYLDVSVLKLDQQGKYTFSEGILTTFLQHGQQKILNDNSLTLTFLIDEGQPEISYSFKKLEECYYARDEFCYQARKKKYEEVMAEYERKKAEGKTRIKKPKLKQPLIDLDKLFNPKGVFKPQIAIKGNHIPGLVECFAHGTYKESPQGFLALLFLPIACNYYQLTGYRSALVIPEITNIPEWVKQRQRYPSRTYNNFRSTSAGESGLRFLLQERLIENNRKIRVNYCEVYQLGKQQWDKSQSYLKQAVYRVKVTDEILELYQNAYYLFPNQVRENDKGETWLATSTVLPWIADNLITNKVWYAGFFEFRKSKQIYERKGLVSMTKYLTPEEQVFFDAIQGAFSAYIREQILVAQKQGRALDYKQVTDKVIYRLQRPNTQPEFATALVDFLSRYRSSKARGVGSEIYLWLHRNSNWKQARDLALLGIVTYTGKGKDGNTEIPDTVMEAIDSESEFFEADV